MQLPTKMVEYVVVMVTLFIEKRLLISNSGHDVGVSYYSYSIVLQHKMFLALFQISVLLAIAVEANHLGQ